MDVITILIKRLYDCFQRMSLLLTLLIKHLFRFLPGQKLYGIIPSLIFEYRIEKRRLCFGSVGATCFIGLKHEAPLEPWPSSVLIYHEHIAPRELLTTGSQYLILMGNKQPAKGNDRKRKEISNSVDRHTRSLN